MDNRVVITIRVPKQDADLIRKAAQLDQRSVTQWSAIQLVRAAREVAK